MVARAPRESALWPRSLKEAEGALVPARGYAQGAEDRFRSSPSGGVLLTSKATPKRCRKAVGSLGAVGPIDKWVAPRGHRGLDPRPLITRGPAPKVPVLAESPLVRAGRRD